MSLVGCYWQQHILVNIVNNSIRNGIVEDILAQQLVPGDLILIGTGDRVPADVRLLEVSSINIATIIVYSLIFWLL